jgi:hypothetical protein
MVASEWSYLESIVETAIWQLAPLAEDAGRAITTHLGMRARLHMLRTLFRLRFDDEEAAKKLDKLCDKIEKAASKRNNLVHALWVRGDFGSPQTLTVLARGTLVKEKAGKHAKAIERVAALIADHSRALQEFLEGHGVVSRA